MIANHSKRLASRAGALAGLAVFLLVLSALVWYAADAGKNIDAHPTPTAFLWIAVLLLVAKVSSLIERFGQPAVLGELVAGVILGNLAFLGITMFEPITHNEIIKFLAELGVVILLFQIGLESNISKMRAVGMRAFLVATIGVVVPFILGTYLVGPFLMPGLSASAYLFLGASLTATSVGITARVFRDLGKLQQPEAQIVLGAAVLDDVMGLIILAVVSAIVTLGSVSLGTISWITAKAVIFLVGSIVGGQLLAPHLGRLLSRVHSGSGMKFTLAIGFGLIFAWLASIVGLAPIVGAFAAGLILDPIHFRHFRQPQLIREVQDSLTAVDKATRQRVATILEHHAEHHIDELIEPVAYFLVPLFFVFTGMEVELETLLNPTVLLVALGVTIAAFVGKIVSGLAAGKVNKWIVGFGMIPRGEVGLIFASIGKSLGVVSDEVFSVIVIMVIASTLVTPIILTSLLRRSAKPAPLSATPV